MKKFLALILALMLVTLLFSACSEKEEVVEETVNEVVEEEEPKEPADPFYDKVAGKSRPVAVMIDNDADYSGPHSGLENAYMIYEVYVEGGSTRMMALFKEEFFEEDGSAEMRIGPVRSSRHYFLDFALENDAIYAHCGWSPKAQAEISSRGVNNINGIYETAPFERYSQYNNTWHNLFTSYAKLDTAADGKNYRRDTGFKSNYQRNYAVPENGASGVSVTIPYQQCNIKYTFNAEEGLYERVRRGNEHVMMSGEKLPVMNILILEMQNVDLNDGENKGRQDLYNTGSGNGKYISGGKAIDITWEKANRDARTKYLANGEEIKLNPGLTFVQIVPPTLGVTVE